MFMSSLLVNVRYILAIYCIIRAHQYYLFPILFDTHFSHRCEGENSSISFLSNNKDS